MMAKKNTKTKVPQKRYTARQTRKFQLRRDHPVDAHVSEILDYSRTKRREVTVIRDGVRLLWALENNDLSVLFEMFPHLKDQFLPGGVNLIEQIRSMLLETHPMPLEPERVGQAIGLKAVNVSASAFALPVFDDDDEDLPTIVTGKNTSASGVTNFIGAFSDL
jgi:hypothetical protein